MKNPATSSKNSPLNSLKHGLTAKTLVLRNESKDSFEQYRKSYLDQYQPEGPVEYDLVEELVADRWRLRRLWAAETAALDVQMDRQNDQLVEEFKTFDEPTRIAMAFSALATESSTLSLLNRFEARLRRNIVRTTQELERIQTTRKGAKQKLPNENQRLAQANQNAPEQSLAPNTSHLAPSENENAVAEQPIQNPQTQPLTPSTSHLAPRPQPLDIGGGGI